MVFPVVYAYFFITSSAIILPLSFLLPPSSKTILDSFHRSWRAVFSERHRKGNRKRVAGKKSSLRSSRTSQSKHGLHLPQDARFPVVRKTASTSVAHLWQECHLTCRQREVIRHKRREGFGSGSAKRDLCVELFARGCVPVYTWQPRGQVVYEEAGPRL